MLHPFGTIGQVMGGLGGRSFATSGILDRHVRGECDTRRQIVSWIPGNKIGPMYDAKRFQDLQHGDNLAFVYGRMDNHHQSLR